MIRLRHLSLIALALGLAACAESSTAPTVTSTDDDYALVMFGEIGSALEGTLGTQSGTQPMDGRSWFGRLPDSLALTAVQRTAIAGLRASFRQNNAAALDAAWWERRDARRGRGPIWSSPPWRSARAMLYRMLSSRYRGRRRMPGRRRRPG